jgi:hypothetical protein
MVVRTVSRAVDRIAAPRRPVTLAEVLDAVERLDAKLDALATKIEHDPTPSRQWFDVEAAAALAERTPQTIRAWCGIEAIGTQVKGRWRVSLSGLRRVVLDRCDGDATKLPTGLR